MPDKVMIAGLKHLKRINAFNIKTDDIEQKGDMFNSAMVNIERDNSDQIANLVTNTKYESDQNRPTSPCHVCHGNTWWWRRNEWLCGRCHPEPSQNFDKGKTGTNVPVKIATGGK